MVRSLAIAAFVAVTSVAVAVRATPTVKLQPGVSLAAGADDNPLFDGQSGDRVGRAALRLRMKAQDHLWSATLDGTASLYGFQERSRLVPLGELTGAFVDHLNREDTLRFRLKMRGSDDPLALAQVGLLGADGLSLGFRSIGQWEHQFEGDPRWDLFSTVRVDGIQRLDPAYAYRSGEVGILAEKPRYQLTRDLGLETSFEGRMFFGQGLAGEAVGALPGVYYRIARRTFLEVEAGALLYHDTTGNVPVPMARATLDWEARSTNIHLAAAQDLTVPNGRAGVLEDQFVEGAVEHNLHDWAFYARAGFYRTLGSPRGDVWTPGYGLEGGAFYRLSDNTWMGLTAMRFDRLSTVYGPEMARDAVYVRFDFGPVRP